MAVPGAQLLQDFETQFFPYSETVKIKYYNQAIAGSYYDDDATLTLSGTSFVSGLPQPVRDVNGTAEAFLMEQGKVLRNDLKLYIQGSVPLSGVIKVGLGSPNYIEYGLVPDGITQWEMNNITVYKKVFLRNLTTGSLIGE